MRGVDDGVDSVRRAATAAAPRHRRTRRCGPAPTGRAGSGTRPASELIMSTLRMQRAASVPGLGGAAQQKQSHQCRLPRRPPGRVQVAVGEALGGQHVADDDDRGPGDLRRRASARRCSASVHAQHRLLRPARESHYRTGCFGAGSRRPAAAGRSRRPARRPGAGPAWRRTADSGAGPPPAASRSTASPPGSASRSARRPGTVSSRPSAAAAAAKAGTPGHDFVVDAQRVESAALLGQRAVQRRVAGVQPRHVRARRRPRRRVR